MSKFGNITVPGTGVADFPPSGLMVVSATLQAHPSNGSILYVKKEADSVLGYPLAAGASVTIGRNNLSDYVVSGAANVRLAYIYEE